MELLVIPSSTLSPRLHNAAYRALGYPALFMPFPVESFHGFWSRVVERDTLESLGNMYEGFYGGVTA